MPIASVDTSNDHKMIEIDNSDDNNDMHNSKDQERNDDKYTYM